jgi:two-component sensor histidine kinase
MPSHFIGKKTGSLGLSLMKGLTEDLDGIFSIENKKGTTITVSFIYDLGARKESSIAGSLAPGN